MQDTPKQMISKILRELEVLQEAYDLLQKIDLFYFDRYSNTINGRVLEKEYQERLQKLFPYDDSE